MVTTYLSEFPILCTVAVLRGAKGATAPGPALLVTQKGPRTWEKIEKKSKENIWIHPCSIKILT